MPGENQYIKAGKGIWLDTCSNDVLTHLIRVEFSESTIVFAHVIHKNSTQISWELLGKISNDVDDLTAQCMTPLRSNFRMHVHSNQELQNITDWLNEKRPLYDTTRLSLKEPTILTYTGYLDIFRVYYALEDSLGDVKKIAS